MPKGPSVSIPQSAYPDDTLQRRVCFAVVRPQVRECAGQNGHRMGVIPESTEESGCVCMHHAMIEDLAIKVGELSPGGEGAIDEEVCTLEERGLGGELFDGVASGRDIGEEQCMLGVRPTCSARCRCRHQCK